MLKDGYRKVILPHYMSALSDQIVDTPTLEWTRSIQDRRFSEMDGAGSRT